MSDNVFNSGEFIRNLREKENSVLKAVDAGLINEGQLLQSVIRGLESPPAEYLPKGSLSSTEYTARKMGLLKASGYVGDIDGQVYSHPTFGGYANGLQLPKSSPVGMGVLNPYPERKFGETESRLSAALANVATADTEQWKYEPVAISFLIEDEMRDCNVPLTKHAAVSISHPRLKKSGLTDADQLRIKYALAANQAVCYMALDYTEWVGKDLQEAWEYIPRYANDHIQPCNLVVRTGEDTTKIFSVFTANGEAASNTVYLKDWTGKISSRVFYRCTDGNHLSVVDCNSRMMRQLKPGSEEYVLVASLLGLYANVFMYRHDLYVKAVQAQLQVAYKDSTDEVVKEASDWYYEDLNPEPTTYTVTVSDALPKLKKYRGVLSKSTGRKMAPHDRSEHVNRRYNPDGSVKMEWKVSAAEVNGGAKSRFGIQVANIISHTKKGNTHD